MCDRDRDLAPVMTLLRLLPLIHVSWDTAEILAYATTLPLLRFL